MGKTYRVFIIKARANDPTGEYKTWAVLFKLAELAEKAWREDSLPNYPHLGLVKSEEVRNHELPR